MNALKNKVFPRQTPSSGYANTSRVAPRERDFGVGYGNSSGYAVANDRRYAQSWAKSLFRCS
jgi:hypothetical protein